MKKIAIFVLIIFFTLIVSYIFFSDHFTGQFPWEEPQEKGVIKRKLHSAILGEDREVLIHLPSSYDSTARYPVMYVLDGGSDDKSIADKFDVLSAVEYTPKTIVVGIPNMTAENRQRNLVPPFMKIDVEESDSPFGNGDTFLRFMESELFPFMEKNYPASQQRLFSGNSRGGLLVMYSLLYKPDMFQGRFCYSTPFWRQNDLLISKVAAFLTGKDTLNTFMYMSAGANETPNIKTGLTRMTNIFKKSAPVGLVWHSDITPQADHHNNAKVSAAIGIGKWSICVKTLSKPTGTL